MTNPKSEMVSEKYEKAIFGNWGYAIVKDNAVWIPAIMGRLGLILDELYKRTKMKRMIFSAVLSPETLKPHLRNIVREWDEWFEEVGDYSHCIEIKYTKSVEAKEKK